MDIQNEILDYLGDQATVETLHEDFDGLNKSEIIAKLKMEQDINLLNIQK